MAVVLEFFIDYAPLIYFFLTLGLLFGLRWVVRARNEKRGAAYGLERQIAQKRMSRAISSVILVSFLAFSEFFLLVFLHPNMPAASLIATGTVNPLPGPLSEIKPGSSGNPISLTPSPSSMVNASGCIPGQIDIFFPRPGEEIKGSVVLKGSANIPNFGFYKYEFSPSGSNQWATILAGNKPIEDGDLGNWDTASITTGDYELRLVITDNQGNELPPCTIPVRIRAS